MLPTFRSILDLPVVRKAHPEILCGDGGLDAPVRWVHVSELMDLAGLLSGGELVLTTGLELDKDPGRTAAYIRSLEAAGAAGLIVELTSPGRGTTTALKAAALGAGMPIAVVRNRVKFVEITEIVHRLIVAEQLEKVEHARDVHEAFTVLSLESAGTAQVVAQAAAMIGAPVVLEDLQHHALAYSVGNLSTAELLHDWERRSRTTPPARQAPDSSGRAGTVARSGPDGWLQVPVGIKAQLWGRLVVPLPPASVHEDETAVMVLERAAQTLAINRLAERDQRGLSEQAQAGLLSALRQPRGLTEAEALARSGSLGLKRSPFYLPVVFRSLHQGSRFSPEASSGDPLAEQQQERVLLERLAKALKSTAGNALTASIESGSVGMLLGLPAKELEDHALQRLAAALAAQAGEGEGNTAARWIIGVGRHRSTLLEAAAGIDEATHVAETAATLRKQDSAYYRATDIRLGGLLALIRNDPRVQQFAESELESVLAAEAAGAEGYLELLGRYLDAGGNKAAMARSGFLSRPTLYARLAKLEELLEVDLSDPESRTSLHVALMLHRLRGQYLE